MAVIKKGGHAVTSVLPPHSDMVQVRGYQPTFGKAVTDNGGQGNGSPSAGTPVDVKSKKKFLNVARSK